MLTYISVYIDLLNVTYGMFYSHKKCEETYQQNFPIRAQFSLLQVTFSEIFYEFQSFLNEKDFFC